MKFRDNLVHLRAVNNMTQEQLAMLIGVSRQSVAKWESGKSYPEMDKLIALCQVFDCTLDELVQGDLSGREASRSSAQTSAACPTDIFGYDEQMRSFAKKISNGVFSILLGIAVSMIFFSLADSAAASVSLYDNGIGYNLENVYCAVALLSMFIGIGAGLALIIPAGIEHSVFVKAHPFIQDFYSPEQKAEARRSFTTQLIAGIGCIFIGICVVIVFGGTQYEELIGLSLLMAFIAIGVRLIISGGMTLGRVDINAYNNSAAECLNAEEIARANIPEANKEMLQSAHKADKRIGAICGTIMMIATIAGLVMLFVPGYQNPLFWLVWPVGGLLCGITAMLIHGFTDDGK